MLLIYQVYILLNKKKITNLVEITPGLLRGSDLICNLGYLLPIFIIIFISLYILEFKAKIKSKWLSDLGKPQKSYRGHAFFKLCF